MIVDSDDISLENYTTLYIWSEDSLTGVEREGEYEHYNGKATILFHKDLSVWNCLVVE